MNTLRFKLTAFFVAALVLGSCSEEFLEVENKNALQTDSYENLDGLRQYNIGIYSINRAIYDYFYTCYGSGLTTEYLFHFTGGEGQTIIQWSDLNPNPDNEFAGFIYGNLYKTIRIANFCIRMGLEKPADIGSASQDELDRIVGGAYFMRALCHFQVMQWWGKSFDPTDTWGIVIQTTPVVDQSQLQISRSKPSEVYTQIISDFQEAKRLLPLESELPNSLLGYPTRGAATAFLGKMYLTRKDYEAAKTEFESFFSENPQKGLLPNFGDNFHGHFENDIESVFEIQYADVIRAPDTWGGPTGRPYQAFMGTSPFGRGNVHIPDYYINKFEENDFRKVESAFSDDVDTLERSDGSIIINIDTVHFWTPEPIRYQATAAAPYGPKKYINSNRDQTNTGGMAQHTCNENEQVMRVAEVYLMYAETLAETGDLPGAFEYMNKVRRRAFDYDPAVYDSSPYDFEVGTKDQFYLYLYDEFAREFIGENVLWFNWLRWGIAEEEATNTGRVFIVGTHEAMPLPQGEINTNLAVEQNPGY